jgi:hypothetical protein
MTSIILLIALASTLGAGELYFHTYRGYPRY